MDASFDDYPLAELCMGILRGNLSGRLDVALHPEPRNTVHFRDGIPVAVALEDVGGSLVELLVQSGALARERGSEVARLAEASGRTQAAVLAELGILALEDGHRRLARARVLRLFDTRGARFRFIEGSALPDRATLTVLEPLPLVYRGLAEGADQRAIRRFLETHGESSFVLAGTYPRGVDPFEWGAEVEQAVLGLEVPQGVQQLAARIGRERAAAALLSLFMVGMVDLREVAPERRTQAGGRPAEPPLEARRVSLPRAPADEPPDSGGLMIHRGYRGGPANRAPNKVPGAQGPSRAGDAHEAQLALIKERLVPYRSMTYPQLLRVSPDVDASQIERAYRFLVRRLADEAPAPGSAEPGRGDAATPDPGRRAVRGLLDEAFQVLTHPERGRRYLALLERSESSHQAFRERQTLEAEVKAERALEVLADGRTAEAAYLLAWIEKLDGTRPELSVLAGVIDLARVSSELRPREALAFEPVVAAARIHRPAAPLLALCHAWVLAEAGDARGARSALVAAGAPSHPFAERVRALLAEPRAPGGGPWRSPEPQ